MRPLPPVIAIDGPAASGKGTIAAGVARALGFHYLDSGSLYRLVALQALRARASISTTPTRLAALAASLDVAFRGGRAIRWTAATSPMRCAPRTCRRRVAGGRPPGGAQRADRAPAGVPRGRRDWSPTGRDMGTVVFPDAALKVFLTASAEERARTPA